MSLICRCCVCCLSSNHLQVSYNTTGFMLILCFLVRVRNLLSHHAFSCINHRQIIILNFICLQMQLMDFINHSYGVDNDYCGYDGKITSLVHISSFLLFAFLTKVKAFVQMSQFRMDHTHESPKGK